MGTLFFSFASRATNFKVGFWGVFHLPTARPDLAITGKILEGQIQKQIFKRLKESLRRLSFRFHVTYPRFLSREKTKARPSIGVYLLSAVWTTEYSAVKIIRIQLGGRVGRQISIDDRTKDFFFKFITVATKNLERFLNAVLLP